MFEFNLGSPEESPTHGVSTLTVVMAFVCPDGRINLAQCPVGRAFLRRPFATFQLDFEKHFEKVNDYKAASSLVIQRIWL